VKRIAGFVFTILLACLCPADSALALDTTEPFERGFSDFEFYLGYAGLASKKEERSFSRGAVMGVGITNSLSAGFSYAIESDEYLKSYGDVFSAWLFWSTVDREKHDLDIFWGFRTGGAICVGAELNFDFPRWGFQLVVQDEIESGVDVEDRRISTLNFAPLVYFNLKEENVQLMSQIDWSYNSSVPQGESELSVGAVSLGLNVMVHDAIELITQLDYEPPSGNDNSSLGISIGFIATVGG
jgi:hypothetical protein